MTKKYDYAMRSMAAKSADAPNATLPIIGGASADIFCSQVCEHWLSPIM